MKEAYNVLQITTFKFTPEAPVKHIQYRPYRKGSFFRSEQISGFYYRGFYKISETSIANSYKIQKDSPILLEKAKVILNYSDGKQIVKTYETNKDAKAFYHHIFNKLINKDNE